MDNNNENQFNEKQYRKSVDDAYEQELNEINAQLEKEILFALVGDVNVGKSSTVNQIMGEDVAKVGAKPGETVEIGRYQYKGKDKIVFIDTPGLNDINQGNSNETIDYYKNADVILFLLNSAGTVFSNEEKKCFDQIQKINKHIVIVLNKIDATSESDIQIQTKFIVENVGSSYPIIPISSKNGQNIDKLRDVVLNVLKVKGKDILFSRFLKDKSPIANKWIIGAAASAGAIGLSPLPGSDIIPITSIQVGLLIKLATLYDKPISKETAKELIISTIVGNVSKTIFRQILKFIPVAGEIVGAAVAGTMTATLGYAVKYAYENNIELDPTSLKAIFEMMAKKKTQSA